MGKKNTQEEVVSRFNEIYGIGKFDYSNVVYVSEKKKVKIGCSKHGLFEQEVRVHYRGGGCPKCNGFRKTTEELVSEFNEVHGIGTFDYSKVVYKGSVYKVEIGCHIHGLFEQRPGDHLSGNGCKKCVSLNQRSSLKGVISEFNKVHGVGTFNYDKVIYENTNSKVKIGCPVHGIFEQSPSSHKNGQGCPKCANKNKTTEDVISEFNKVHGVGTFDYSKVIYVNSHTKVKIKCPVHGIFEQRPTNHKSGNGCRECSRKVQSEEEVISEFNKIHGVGTFNYDEVVYKNSHSKVKIGCSVHGIFEQSPDSHKNRNGCSKCHTENMTKRIISDFNKVHGKGTFDYGKVVYINIDSKVKIGCPVHGIFEKSPYDHRKGTTCPKCMGRCKTTEDIISEFNKIHGVGTFNYDEVIYKNSHSKVKIGCPVHGIFEQSPSNHKKVGKKCGKCVGLYKTRESVIEEFNKIHGIGTFNYDKVVYVDNITKVKIGCPLHGIFEQSPANHKNGHGCQKCVGRDKTTEEIISEFNEVHGVGTFDYSKVVYVTKTTNITIGCSKHGWFEQEVRVHHVGGGCPKCRGMGKTTKELILEFNEVHGTGTFNYDEVVYVASAKKVKIRCHLHGIFEQSPSNHKKGHGCPKCIGRYQTKEEFIIKAKEIHGTETYDYDDIDYIDSTKKIKITCMKHGIFEQSPYKHLDGVSCMMCSREKRFKKQEKVISDFNEIHGEGTFDYSRVVYSGAKNEIIIGCKKHGFFKQSPNSHQQGVGCSKCSPGGFNSNEKGILYYLRVEKDNKLAYKIGITNYDAKKRWSHEKEYITILYEKCYENGKEALKMETEIKKQFKFLCCTGKAMIGVGNTELFELDVLGLDNGYKKSIENQ